MKNFNWEKYSKPVILAAFIVILSILRPKAFLSLDNFSNVLWSVSVIGIMVSGTIFVFLIGGIDLSIASLCAFTATVVVSVTHAMGDTPGTVAAGVVAALAVGALAGVIHGVIAGKPMDDKYHAEYKAALREVIDDPRLPILCNVNIGHALPRCIIPFGPVATVDAEKQTITFAD